MYFPRFDLFAGGLDGSLPTVVSWDPPPIGVLLFSCCPAGGVLPRFIEATTTLPPMSSLRPDSGDMLASDILRLPRSRAAGQDKTSTTGGARWVRQLSMPCSVDLDRVEHLSFTDYSLTTVSWNVHSCFTGETGRLFKQSSNARPVRSDPRIRVSTPYSPAYR